jgi:predicted membrane channel-forming protein YqfA (hemolysin III family)
MNVRTQKTFNVVSVQISVVIVKNSICLSLDLTNSDNTPYLVFIKFVIVFLEGILYIGAVFCMKK